MARARRRRLRKAIGIETKGGIFTSLIPAGSALPAEYSFILTTADDYQAAVQICVLQGGHHLAARNKKLGVFEVTGFALGRRKLRSPSTSMTAVRSCSPARTW